MLNKFLKNTKLIVKHLPNFNSFINMKNTIYFGLAAYWSFILINTFLKI